MKVTGKNLLYEQEFQEYFINSVADTVGLATGNVSCVLQVVTGAKYYVTRSKIGTKFRVAVVDKLPTLGNPVTPSSSINADSKRQIEISATSKYMVIQCEDEAAFSELMVSLDSSTTYSPYREQLLTLPTPNGLPGIPVSSGGNYTDQNGQQWVCDEVDLERGVKVQRVGKRTITTQDTFLKSGLSTNDVNYFSLANFFVHIGTTGKKNALISNRFVTGNNQNFGAAGKIFQGGASGNGIYFSVDAQKYPDAETFKQWAVENGLMFLYQLTDIIETPLTPTEIDAYKALTAYAPDTVVQASDEAGIKLDYQRDVNLVVKNLEDAIASMTTTT